MELDYSGVYVVKKIRRHSLAGRFLKKVRVSEVLFHEGSACWEWQAGKDKSGYGRFVGLDDHYAHRVSYKYFIGEIPDDLEIDHRCRRRHCVNPLHLEAVTHPVNQLRFAELKTQCDHGHDFTEDNIYRTKNGQRGCKKCRYQRIAEWRLRNPDVAREKNTASKKAWRQKQLD